MMKENTHTFKSRGIRWTVAILLVVAAFAAGALWRGGRSADVHRHDHAAAAPVAEATRAPQMYTCSMHPQVRSPDPDDKCPICAMSLIPVPEDDDDGEDDADVPRLRLSSRAAALMEIRTWPVERRSVEIEVALFGKIGVDESRLHNVATRTEAYIERLVVNTPWQSVAKGDTLAELYSPAVVTAMRELRVAGTSSPAVLEATRARLQRLGVSARQIREIEQADDIPRTFRVESPAAGVLLSVPAREGEWLREGGHLTRIADVSRVWINLEAYERDLRWLGEGQTTHFTVAGLPGQRFEGMIAFIDPVLDERSRTVRLRVEVDNPDGILKPGMFVSARVQAPYRASPAIDLEPLLIPITAPLITGRRALVYVRVPDTDRPTFEPRQVTLGPRVGDAYIVEDGVNAGELVVVNGQFKIDSELQIRGRPSMMTAASPDAGETAAAGIRLQTDCPVMGGPINPELHVDVNGLRIYVCCPGCDKAILDDPETFIGKLEAEGVTPYRLQTHCPIMGGAINRDLYHDHDGWRIYICCPGCLDEVRENAGEIIEEQRKRGIVFEKSPAPAASDGSIQ